MPQQTTKYFDSHAHIQLIKKPTPITHYRDYLDSIIEVAIDLPSYTVAKQLMHAHPGFIYCTVGIHPSQAAHYTPSLKQELTRSAQEQQAVAIGECGLDSHYPRPDMQTQLFHDHIILAKDLALPLIIHCRNAHSQALQILTSHAPFPKGGVIHCYSGTLDEAYAYIGLNFYISFAGNITYKTAHTLQEVCTHIPQERLLIETDSPYLTPVPHRGQENTPLYIQHTAEYISKLKGLSLHDLAQSTAENARQAFSIIP